MKLQDIINYVRAIVDPNVVINVEPIEITVIKGELQ